MHHVMLNHVMLNQMNDEPLEYAELFRRQLLRRNADHDEQKESIHRSNNQIYTMYIFIMIFVILGIVSDVCKRFILDKTAKEQIECPGESDMMLLQEEQESPASSFLNF